MEHRIISDVYEIHYWRDNAAAELATANRARVHIIGHPHYPEFTFAIENGRHPHEMEKLLVALDRAFKRGQQNWAAQMRKVLEGPR